jgi:hypothetical protein
MENKKKKVKVFFTMNIELHEKFEKHINDNILDKSKLIEKLIADYMENNPKCA